jgi:hypothetical protein
MNSIRSRKANGDAVSDSGGNAALIAAMLLIGAVVALPIALDLARGSTAPSKDERTAKVTLTCFDRHMRAHPCDVAATTVAVQAPTTK